MPSSLLPTSLHQVRHSHPNTSHYNTMQRGVALEAPSPYEPLCRRIAFREVVLHVSRPYKVHVSVLGSAAGWERFERQSKYTVGGFYCTCPFSNNLSNASFQTTAPFLQSLR
jgi:hypothetical protein